LVSNAQHQSTEGVVTRNIARIDNARNARPFDDKFFVDEAISQADEDVNLEIKTARNALTPFQTSTA